MTDMSRMHLLSDDDLLLLQARVDWLLDHDGPPDLRVLRATIQREWDIRAALRELPSEGEQDATSSTEPE